MIRSFALLGSSAFILKMRHVYENNNKLLPSTSSSSPSFFLQQDSGAPTNEDTHPRKHWKNVGAPEFRCPGTRTLVPFQVDNRFFVLISKMGFRNINLSFFPSVFMCSRHFLFLLEHCQHKWEYTIKKTPEKNGGAPEFWCPLCSWLIALFLFMFCKLCLKTWPLLFGWWAKNRKIEMALETFLMS